LAKHMKWVSGVCCG